MVEMNSIATRIFIGWQSKKDNRK